jgi:hypothetical protein
MLYDEGVCNYLERAIESVESAGDFKLGGRSANETSILAITYALVAIAKKISNAEVAPGSVAVDHWELARDYVNIADGSFGLNGLTDCLLGIAHALIAIADVV